MTNINLYIKIVQNLDLQWNKSLVLPYLFTFTILIILLLYLWVPIYYRMNALLIWILTRF